MKLSVKRRIYYTSVIISLIAILVSAVVINRTLVNTPKIDIEKVSDNAGEPVSCYMAYFDENDEIVVGITEDNDEALSEIIGYIKNVDLSSPIEKNDELKESLDAWVILYDKDNKISSRMNFYNGGEIIWYDGERYEGIDGVMEKIIEFCDTHKEETEEPSPSPEEISDESPKGQTND